MREKKVTGTRNNAGKYDPLFDKTLLFKGCKKISAKESFNPADVQNVILKKKDSGKVQRR